MTDMADIVENRDPEEVPRRRKKRNPSNKEKKDAPKPQVKTLPTGSVQVPA